MLTSKERAKLKALANSIDTILQVGKGGVIDTLVKQVDDALEARELIKLRVLENSLLDPRAVGQELADVTASQVVQVIGSKVILYRRRKKDSKIGI